MNKILQSDNKIKYIKGAATAFLCVLFFVCVFFSLRFFSVSADVNISPSLFLPSSPIEYNAPENLKDAVYLPDGRIATIQGNDVVIYLTDGTKQTVSGLTSLKQIKILDENYILVSADGTIRKISLNDYSYVNFVGGNYFDLNGNYLITAYSSDLKVYDISNPATHLDIFGANGDNPIAINANNDIFYFLGDNLYTRNYGDLSSIHDLGQKSIKGNTNIIADENFVYYIGNDNAVYRININDYTSTKLIIDATDFDLGKLVSPVSLSFKSDNLLITDNTVNAVQEFKVDGNKLVFTGFAIANGKTAFNRIGKTAKAISSYGKSVAALDGYKLTVIKDVTKSLYLKDNYVNVLAEDTPFIPNDVSLGESTALLYGGTKIAIISAENGAKIYELDLEGNDITGVCYQDGYYYIAKTETGSGDDTGVYKIDETDGNYNIVLTATDDFGAATLISTDVFNNIYLTKNGYIYRAEKTENGYSSPVSINPSAAIANISKISTDLNGNVFAFTGNAVYYISGGVVRNVPLSSAFKSFALSFDSKSVYFIKADDERIYKTDILPNMSINDVSIPADFKITGNSADVTHLKSYELKNGSAAYKVSVTDGEKFVYEKAAGGAVNEYILICAVNYETIDTVNGNTVSLNLLALLGCDENKKPVFILADERNAAETLTVSVKEKTTYVSTDVNVYFLPMITENKEFCIKDGDNILRIIAKTEISVKAEIKFKNSDFNEKFFYIEYKNSAGETVKGYIPENFTVDVLSENASSETNISRVKSENQNSFRNSLIVIALAASVFGTSLFFILKKKS